MCCFRRWWARLRERAADDILVAAAAGQAEERRVAVERVLRESRLAGNRPARWDGAPPWNRGRR